MPMPIPPNVGDNEDYKFVYHHVNNEYLEGLQTRNEIIQHHFTHVQEE